jgi:hypothetical protein
MNKLLAALGAERRAFALSLGWLFVMQALALLAWNAGLLSRDAAVVHWVLLGVMPPAMALAGLPGRPSR